jgi:hypothetical protein
LLCGAYIDLNAARANIVEKPEDYRWCSLGMRVRASKRARRLLTWVPVSIGNYSFIAGIQKEYKRKFIRPRSFLEVEGNRLFVTRVLRL